MIIFGIMYQTNRKQLRYSLGRSALKQSFKNTRVYQSQTSTFKFEVIAQSQYGQ